MASVSQPLLWSAAQPLRQGSDDLEVGGRKYVAPKPMAHVTTAVGGRKYVAPKPMAHVTTAVGGRKYVAPKPMAPSPSFPTASMTEPVAHPAGGPTLLTAEAAAGVNASTDIAEAKKGSAARSSTNEGAEGDFSATSANPASHEAPPSQNPHNKSILDKQHTDIQAVLNKFFGDEKYEQLRAFLGGQPGWKGDATEWDIAVREWPTMLLLPMQALVLVVSIFVLPWQGAYQVADWSFDKFPLILCVPLAGLGLSFYIMGDLAMKWKGGGMKTVWQVDDAFQDSRDSKATLALSMMMAITVYFLAAFGESKVKGCIAGCVQAVEILQKSKIVMNLKAERSQARDLNKSKDSEEQAGVALKQLREEVTKRGGSDAEIAIAVIDQELQDSNKRLSKLTDLEAEMNKAGQAQDAPEAARLRTQRNQKRLRANADAVRLARERANAEAERLRKEEEAAEAVKKVERLSKEAADAVRLREEERRRKDEAVRLSNQAKEEVERLREEAAEAVRLRKEVDRLQEDLRLSTGDVILEVGRLNLAMRPEAHAEAEDAEAEDSE